MKPILVPTDFSENAANALDYAVQIAKTTRSRIILLHTFQIPVMDTSVPTFMVQSMIEEEEKRCEEELSKIANDIARQKYQGTEESVDCEYIVKQGFAVEEILYYSREKDARMVIMGTQGASGIKRIILGSNTAYVIERTTVPVIAVPAKASWQPIQKVVYATELQDGDESVVKSLVVFCRLFKATITILHIGKSETDEIKEKLERFKQKVAEVTNYSRLDYQVFSHPSVPEGISKYLEENNVNLLAMVSHKRNLFSQLFSASLTKKMAFHSEIPLMAYRN